MAYTSPRTWATGEVVTASQLNTHLRDNMKQSGTPVITFAQEGTLAVASGVMRWRVPEDSGITTIEGVTAAVNTAPTGQALNLDVNKNGTSIWPSSSKPSIAAAANATSAEVVPDTTAITEGDYLTVDIDQVGSTVAGSDLTVFIRFGRD